MLVTPRGQIKVLTMPFVGPVLAVHVVIAFVFIGETRRPVEALELVVVALNVIGRDRSGVTQLLVRTICTVLLSVAESTQRDARTVATTELAINLGNTGAVLLALERPSNSTEARVGTAQVDADVRAASVAR